MTYEDLVQALHEFEWEFVAEFEDGSVRINVSLDGEEEGNEDE